MKKSKYFFLSAVLSVFIAIPGFAKPDIKLILESSKVVNINGKEALQSADEGNPGDILLYTLKVVNNGDSPAYELEPEGGIPTNTVYIPEKKNLKDIKTSFSIDQGKTFQEIPKIKIKQNGKLILKDAPVELYNKIRWTIPKLDPNKKLSLTYKVKIR